MNPSPSAQNPISQPLKKANPSSHFTPSRPSHYVTSSENNLSIFFFSGKKEKKVVRRRQLQFSQLVQTRNEVSPYVKESKWLLESRCQPMDSGSRIVDPNGFRIPNSLDIDRLTSSKDIMNNSYFAVVCLVVWPLNENEAGVDFVLIETSLLLKLFSC